MGGTRDGILGTDADIRSGKGGGGDIDVFGGGARPGTLGADEATPLDDTPRIIAKVVKDWDPPKPNRTPIVAHGTTLLEAGRSLNAQGEWGKGGGWFEAEHIHTGTSTNLTVTLHAHLVHRLPTWTGYAKASQADKDEWDKMVGFLKIHEDRHLQFSIEGGDQLARDLIGHDISDIKQMVKDANDSIQAKQDELDDDTDHGAKEGVPYGDVILHYIIK